MLQVKDNATGKTVDVRDLLGTNEKDVMNEKYKSDISKS